MGFHVCEYCPRFGETLSQPPHTATSSGDVTLYFADRELGHKWVMPDMIVHYVRDHGYQPPQDFINDVMQGQYVGGERWQTRGISPIPKKPVGYLSGDYPQGEVPSGFLDKLQILMQKASDGKLPKLA